MSNYSEDSSLRIYMREISETPLLTKEDEIQLAEQIKDGDEKARARMIKANLRLVVKIARDYSNYGLPLVDLISEGNIGLMKAVERFDPSFGAKVSTYAAWWIKQSIKRALANQSKTIRLPVHMIEKITKMRKASDILKESLGHEPSDEELAEELGITTKKLALLKRSSQRPTSLDAPINDGESTGYAEIIGDEKAVDPSETLESKNLHDELDGLLETLDERQVSIIKARFGLSGKPPQTLEEVGLEFGVTRERIRQLQNVALEKMRKTLSKKDRPELASLLAN